MNRWNSLLAVAVSALLAAPAVSADEGPSTLQRPYGDVMSEFDKTQAAAPSDEAQPSEIAEAETVEGEVAAVDHETGAVVLNTDEGFIGLVTSRDEVADLEVGDRVRVSFVDDELD
jgi:DNA replication initiation complex subunit (GINS family)